MDCIKLLFDQLIIDKTFEIWRHYKLLNLFIDVSEQAHILDLQLSGDMVGTAMENWFHADRI